ncbi:MAG TPA: M20 family metallopeptidase [Pyrinomonadaceae bacterium]|jgi:glutamate carboxypeptidase|nr:M20 family metallopeptidase [Pyrinomonadaceae bacterium]
MTAGEIRQYFERRQETIIDAIREIVDIESPSFDVAQSDKVTDWIERQAFSLPVSPRVEKFAATDVGKHILIGPFEEPSRHTLIIGHTDTVHPIGTNAKNPTRIEGDRLYGCGVFDMKANVVLTLEVLRFFAVTGTPLSQPVTAFFSCDEEVGSATGRGYIELEAAKADRCFVLEPSADGNVKTGRKGTGMFQLAAYGVPAHAGLEPEKGANAVAELARQIPNIHATARPEIGTTVNVTTFHGGTTLNVIPDHAVGDIDVRYSVASEAERVVDELASLISADPRVTLELTGAINRPPLERTNAVVSLYEKARGLAASFDYELGEAQVGGGSDGNFVAALGVPVLDGLGLAGNGAHTLDEYVLLSDIAKRATLLTLLVMNA